MTYLRNDGTCVEGFHEDARASDADYEELDPLIRGTVRLLREAGFRTYSSCQGGEGHGFRFPTVRMMPDDERTAEETRVRLLAFLTGKCRGFTISCNYSYGGPDLKTSGEELELEFWSLGCLPQRGKGWASVLGKEG